MYNHTHMHTPTQRHREMLEVMGTNIILTVVIVSPHGYYHCLIPKCYAYVQAHQIVCIIKNVQFLMKTK